MDRETEKLILQGLGLQIELLTEIHKELVLIRQATEEAEEETGATHLGDRSGTFKLPQSF